MEDFPDITQTPLVIAFSYSNKLKVKPYVNIEPFSSYPSESCFCPNLDFHSPIGDFHFRCNLSNWATLWCHWVESFPLMRQVFHSWCSCRPPLQCSCSSFYLQHISIRLCGRLEGDLHMGSFHSLESACLYHLVTYVISIRVVTASTEHTELTDNLKAEHGSDQSDLSISQSQTLHMS